MKTKSTSRAARSHRIMLLLGAIVIILLSCDVINNLSDQYFEEDPCYRDGNSLKHTGSFVPRPEQQVWDYTTNTIQLQYNTNCSDVYGYAEIVQQLSGIDRTEVGTSRISFKGTYNHQTMQFKGTVYVDYDLICTGNCGEPHYAFDYPANWNARVNSGTYDITGWIDGIGDFKLGTGVAMEGKAYRDVPGLDIWP